MPLKHHRGTFSVTQSFVFVLSNAMPGQNVVCFDIFIHSFVFVKQIMFTFIKSVCIFRLFFSFYFFFLHLVN